MEGGEVESVRLVEESVGCWRYNHFSRSVCYFQTLQHLVMISM